MSFPGRRGTLVPCPGDARGERGNVNVYSCANENFTYVVAAPGPGHAARAMAETQGYHGYDFDRALAALDVYPGADDDAWAEKALASPLTVHRSDRPRYGMTASFVALTASVGTMGLMTYERAERSFNEGFLTASQWAAYGYVWRTSVERHSNVGAEHTERPTDPFVVTIIEALEALIAKNR